VLKYIYIYAEILYDIKYIFNLKNKRQSINIFLLPLNLSSWTKLVVQVVSFG